MLQFGLRLGARPRQLITTTPRPIALIKRLLADPRTAVTRAATQANAAYLSPAFLDEILARYAGTRLGRQEIDGEVIEDRADALWTRAVIEAARVDAGAAACRASSSASIRRPRRAKARTPAASSRPASRERRRRLCAGGRERARAGARRLGGAAPSRFIARREADAIVAEVNQGGDMVRARAGSRSTPRCRCAQVHATRGKWLRAEPVAALYAQGKVKHVGARLRRAGGRDVRLRP